MSYSILTHYVSQFSTNVELLLQQQGSRLRGIVKSGTHQGKQASPVNQFGATGYSRRTGKYEPITPTDAPTDRRWVYPITIDADPVFIDKYDNLRSITDPTSSYVQNAVNSLGRGIDDVILEAYFGTNQTGETGGTSTTFLAANQVPVTTGKGSATGINAKKIKAGYKLLLANEVDMDNDPIYCVINATQNDQLLDEAQIVSKDFNEKAILDKDGRIKQWLGVNFIHSQRLTLNSSSYRRIPMFAKSGMYLGLFDDIKTEVQPRHDIKGHPMQVTAEMTIGATRLEEKKIVELICSE
jgi:hypothetical protein